MASKIVTPLIKTEQITPSWFEEAVNGFFNENPFHQAEFSITIFGFCLTAFFAVWGLMVARKIKSKMLVIDSIVSISEVQAVIEETRRYIRIQAWALLPESYTRLRKLLVEIINSNIALSKEQKEALEKAIQQTKQIEETVNKDWSKGISNNQANYADSFLRDQADQMNRLSIEIRMKVN